MRHVRVVSIWIAALAIGAFPAAQARATCTPVPNPVWGELVGCCQSNGQLKAPGSTCIGETLASGRINTCMKGTCNASGDCVGPFTGVDSSGYHPRCVDPGNTCTVGECYGTGVCKNIDNSTSKGKLLRCTNPPDTNRCTKDCIEVAAATDPFGFTCNNEPDPLYFPDQFPCSIVSGGATCQKGKCDGAGTCNPDLNEPSVECSGSMDECDEWICEDLDPVTNDPVCQKRGVPLGTPCDTADPNDCHTSFCDGGATNGTCRSHHEENEGNDCTYGKSDCHYGLCASGGGCNGDFLRATDYPCATDNNVCTLDLCNNTGGASTCYHYGDSTLNGITCATDNNDCTLDVCNATGTCTHAADGAMQGQVCSDTNPCTLTSTCNGSACTPATCATTGVCYNCSGAPSCVNNLGNSCGCG